MQVLRCNIVNSRRCSVLGGSRLSPPPPGAKSAGPNGWASGMTRDVAAVVVAGGRGLRAGGDLPKQYRTLGNVPVLHQSLAVFAHHAEIHWVQPVIHRDDGALYAEAAKGLSLLPPAFGGATRQASVRAGLEALASKRPAIVLVHDAARPF